jgi:nucleoside-diphosphate-sugar epimerase
MVQQKMIFYQIESITNQQTPYSINKLQVENGLSELASKNFSPIALRFGTVYGLSSRIRFDVVIIMLCGLALTSKKITLNSNSQAWRPHLHIEDVCQSFHRCIEWNPDKGELIIPFYKLCVYVISLTSYLSLIKLARISLILLKLNVKVIYERIKSQVKFLFIYLKLIKNKTHIK